MGKYDNAKKSENITIRELTSIFIIIKNIFKQHFHNAIAHLSYCIYIIIVCVQNKLTPQHKNTNTH